MDKSFKNVLVNSTLAFISAFIITTIFHEFGHYLSYLLFGTNPTLFHNYVQTSNQPLSLHTKVISSLAGPFFSLIQGLVVGYLVINRKENTPIYLFLLWLSLLGFVNCFGYLVMTPFTITGDTGKVAELLNMDFYLRIVIAVVGFMILLWVVCNVAKYFAEFIPAQTEKAIKAKYIYRLMFFPIVIGSVANAILAFPVVAILSIIYPATSSYVIMSSFPVILKTKSLSSERSIVEDKIQCSLIALVICTIVVNRLLTFGIG